MVRFAGLPEGVFKAPNSGAGDGFGMAIALSAPRLAVGAYGEDGSATTINGPVDDDAEDAGAVYVFE